MAIRGSVTSTESTLADCVTLAAVIAFLVAVADPSRFETIAAPGIERVREGDSLVVTVRPEEGWGPQRVLNKALDELADQPDLEAVVILHEDVVLLDPDTASIVRDAFADPDIAIAGAIGAQGIPGLAWWGGIPIGRTETAYVPDGVIHGVAARGPVDALDGLVLCLSPWAARTLRFDEALAADFHGYDIDLCFQARHHGRRVEVIPLAVRHDHRPLFTDTERWARNELRFQQQWLDHRPISDERHQALAAPEPG